ncbi:hypothetical protein CVT26_005906 [Gymnopilus dilepis]|uniref:Uncharacterized protein n=1 Tax=Gymnopilus dilepis TaxID=231916 RepID=A0A409Y1N6_9AGAR|nr:hypothetical protein CVT26_005906 [Gymnopilus dilepis]
MHFAAGKTDDSGKAVGEAKLFPDSTEILELLDLPSRADELVEQRPRKMSWPRWLLNTSDAGQIFGLFPEQFDRES